MIKKIKNKKFFLLSITIICLSIVIIISLGLGIGLNKRNSKNSINYDKPYSIYSSSYLSNFWYNHLYYYFTSSWNYKKFYISYQKSYTLFINANKRENPKYPVMGFTNNLKISFTVNKDDLIPFQPNNTVELYSYNVKDSDNFMWNNITNKNLNILKICIFGQRSLKNSIEYSSFLIAFISTYSPTDHYSYAQNQINWNIVPFSATISL